MIQLSEHLTTVELAKKFRVHTTTVTRTIKKKDRILNQASRVNLNFKTVQTNFKSEEHDSMVLDYIRSKQGANIPISVADICDKAIEYANILKREIKSRRAWWRRFRIRCNVVRMRLGSQGGQKTSDEDQSGEVTNVVAEDRVISLKKVITLPTINLPNPTSTKESSESSSGSSSDASFATGERDGKNKDLVECGNSRVENNIGAKESGNLDGQSGSPSRSKQDTIPPKRRNSDRKAGKSTKASKKKRKRMRKSSAVINFTFKIKKTSPSKNVAAKVESR